MQKKIVAVLMVLLLCSCTKTEKKIEIGRDFESLMGKDFSQWQYVRTKEDLQNLAFFKSVYDRNIPLLNQGLTDFKIPKILHYVWIGPKPFPRESVEWVRTWLAQHPDWECNLWTDRVRPLPQPGMKLRLISDFSWQYLKECYDKSDNFGEKSDLLRYELIYQLGGIFVDHDVKCFRSFEPINKSYDLFCGMEMPHPTSLASSVLPTNNILGGKPGHPVIKECMEWLVTHWDQIEKDYPGKDRDAVIDRVSHRTFLALGEAFKKSSNQTNNIDIAFPTMYFNAPKDEFAIYSRHLYEGTWFDNESTFEKQVRERLMKLSKKSNQSLLLSCMIGAANLIGLTTLVYLMRRRRG